MRVPSARLVLSLTAALACSCEDARLFIARTWPGDQALVVVITDASDRPVESAPRVYAPDEIPRFELPSGALVRFHLRTFRSFAGGGPDLDGCGVRFGGAAAVLPEPASSWVTPLVDPGAGGDVTPAEELSKRDLDLRYERCFEERYPCERITLETIRVSDFADYALISAVALSDDLAFVASNVTAGAQASTARIDGTTFTRLPDSSSVAGKTESLAWDRASTIHATTSPPLRYELSREGALIATHTITSTARGIAAGEDGTVAIFGETGIEEVRTGSASQPRLMSFSDNVHILEIVGAQRALAVTETHFLVWNGTRWQPEYMIGPSAFEKWDGAAIDADVMVAVDRSGQVIVRDESRGSWAQIERAVAEGLRWRTAAGIGNGRFIAVGDSGAASVWTGREWCPMLATNTPSSLRDIAVSPSNRVAFVVGTDDGTMNGDQPIAIKISLPESP